MTETNLPSVERLRWQCRRGMLELDCVLEDFLEQKYQAQDDRTKALFVQLLEVQDPDLNNWIMNGVESDNDEMNEIVKLVRGY